MAAQATRTQPERPACPVTIGALRESAPHETRVSLVPEVADKLAQTGARVVMERGAGARAQFPDALYKNVEWADDRPRRCSRRRTSC